MLLLFYVPFFGKISNPEPTITIAIKSAAADIVEKDIGALTLKERVSDTPV